MADNDHDNDTPAPAPEEKKINDPLTRSDVEAPRRKFEGNKPS